MRPSKPKPAASPPAERPADALEPETLDEVTGGLRKAGSNPPDYFPLPPPPPPPPPTSG